MKLLVYDTSSDVLSAALYEGTRQRAQFESPFFTRHSNVLASTIDKLLKKCGWKVGQIDCLALGLGPGSFTGLRVGVMTAKVLAYTTGARLVGVPSLEVLASGAHISKGLIAVMLDAKKEKVYAALYQKQGDGILRVVIAPHLSEERAFLRRAGDPDAVLRENFFPKASELAKLALGRIHDKKFTDPFKLEPLYLHPRDCNVTKIKI